MGRRGRPPEPIPLKILKGRGNGTDQAGKPIPKPPPFERGAPEPPDWLSPIARELWDRTAPTLESLGLLKPEDYTSFVAYCECFATYCAALAQVRKHGLVYSGGGRIAHKNPAVAVLESAGAQMLRYAREFGLTPAAEAALAKPVEAVVDDDVFGGKYGEPS